MKTRRPAPSIGLIKHDRISLKINIAPISNSYFFSMDLT